MVETPLPAVHFATSLTPHRSLSPEAFRWLIGGAIAANLLVGLPMMIIGAWPVFGFMGLDVLLLWWLFKRSYLDARRSETLLLTDLELIVSRVAPGRRARGAALDAYWLKIELTEERLVVSLARQPDRDRPLPGAGRAPARGRTAQGGAGRDACAALSPRPGTKSPAKGPARPSCRRGRASCPPATWQPSRGA